MSVGVRGKRVVVQYGPTLVALLLVCGLAGVGSAAWLYTNPGTETVTEQRYEQTVSSDVRTSAVVVGNTTLYEEGERLSDRPVYLLDASPNLTLTVRTAVPDNVTTELDQRLVLELRGTKDGEPFWRSERVLVERTTRTSSGTVRSSVTVNVSRLERELQAARAEVGEVGIFHSRLRLNTSYATDRYQGRLTATAPIQVTERAYWIEGDLRATRTESTTVRTEVPAETDRAVPLGLGAFGIVSLAAAGLLWSSYRGLDRSAVRTELSRNRYAEWISEGECPTGVNKKYVRINSLEDLVDVGIDSNKRVIFDDTYDIYAVTDGDIVYYYTEDFDRVEAWLDI